MWKKGGGQFMINLYYLCVLFGQVKSKLCFNIDPCIRHISVFMFSAVFLHSPVAYRASTKYPYGHSVQVNNEM